MNLCTCFLLFGIFAHTHSSYLRKPITSERHDKETRRNDRQFNVKENLNNAFVKTNETVTGDNNMLEPYPNVKTFTDFVAELINILNTYNDDLFEDFVEVLDEVIKKYHNRDCKYYDLKGKHEFRSLMAAKLDSFAKLTIKEKRTEINKILLLIRLKRLNIIIKEFLDYVNSLYKKDNKGRFRIILSALKSYGTGYSDFNTKDDFINIVKECVKATVFYHIDLSSDVREKLKTYMNNVNSLLPKSNADKLNNIGPTAKKSDSTIGNITENISTEDKTNETSLKTKTIGTNEYVKEKNKRITMFRTETNKTQSKDDTTLLKTTKNDRNSEQKEITYSNTETVMKEMFFMTTEEPGVVFKSEIRSKLVERMLGQSAGMVVTAKSTTADGPSLLNKQDLRKSMATPVPGEDLSTDILNRESGRIKNKTILRSNSITTEPYKLNYYKHLKRHLQKKLDRLKKIDEINQATKAKGKGDNDDRDKKVKKEKKSSLSHTETKHKKHRNKRKGKKSKNSKLVSGGKSNEYDARVLRNKNKVKNTKDGVQKIINEKEDEHKLKRKPTSIENNKSQAHKLRNKKKNKRNKSKKTRKYTTTCKCDTNEAETSTKPKRRKSKKNAVFKSIDPLVTTKDNTGITTVNNDILEKPTLNAANKVENPTSNVSKDIKQNRMDDTATGTNVKKTEDKINEETSTQSYRRVYKAFPSIFKGETLKEGFYPAHLWD